MSDTSKVIQKIQETIDRSTRDLSDEAYVEVLEDIGGYCDIAVEAKREEMG